MRRIVRLVVVAAVVAVLAAPAEAQRRPRGQGGRGGFAMSGLMLLGQKSVQEELKLSTDQVKKIEELNTKNRENFGKLRDLDREERAKKMQEINKENQKAVAGILSKEQAKRLHQLTLQIGGSRSFANPEVAKELKLTDDQQKKIKDIQEAAQQEQRKLFQGGGGDREAARKKMQEIRKATNDKVMGVLTADQKAKWKEMTGEPFKGQLNPFGGGRRPRRPQ